MCWKYKLSMLFIKNKLHVPICCVGCKYAKNNRCTKGIKKSKTFEQECSLIANGEDLPQERQKEANNYEQN